MTSMFGASNANASGGLSATTSQPPSFYSCSSATSTPSTVIVTPGGHDQVQPELPDQTPPDPAVLCPPSYPESPYFDPNGLSGGQNIHHSSIYGHFAQALPLPFLMDFGFHDMFQSPPIATADVPGSSGTQFLQLGNRLNPIGQPSVSGSGQFIAPQPPLPHPQLQAYQPLLGAVPSMPSKRPGGRRPKEYEMPAVMENDDDHEKRMKRRLRNKEAAARCRQRRLDLMQQLQQEVDRWKSENQMKDSMIQELRRQKDMLEQFLRNHDCKLPENQRLPLPMIPSTTASSSSVTHEYQPNVLLPRGNMQQPLDFLSDSKVSLSNGVTTRKRAAAGPQENVSPIKKATFQQPKMEPELTLSALNSDDVQRPDTLGLGVTVTTSASSLGGPLATPSNGLTTPYAPAGNVSGALPTFSREFPSLTSGVDWSVGGGLLQQETGLTPCASNTMNFQQVPNTVTPLQQNSDLATL